jgi:hypothetical protein
MKCCEIYTVTLQLLGCLTHGSNDRLNMQQKKNKKQNKKYVKNFDGETSAKEIESKAETEADE